VVPIASVVRFEKTTAPQQINHIEEMSSVTLSVKPKKGVPLSRTMDELQNQIITPLRLKGVIPDTVFTSLAGTADKLTQTKQALIGDFRGLVKPGYKFFVIAFAGVGMLLLTVVILGQMTPVDVAPVFNRWSIVKKLGWPALGVITLAFFVYNYELTEMLIQSRAVLALLITYLLMAALFESFAYPFVIMFSVPLAAVGGFAALNIVHRVSLYDVTAPIQQFDVLTMLGFVILIGIVVNNAILIVHQALNYMRHEQLTYDEAVVKSVKTRVRPIFMSATTSVFGMLPLVLMTGAGSELYRGIGSVVVGGLAVSTIFTLFVVPAMFSLFLDAKAWASRQHVAADALPIRPVPAATDVITPGFQAGATRV